MTGSNNSSAIQVLAYLMIAAVLVFIGVCTAAQFWRTDLNWIAIPLSTYLFGPGGVYVRSAYYLMAIALLGFAWVSYVATAQAHRSALASCLFMAAGVALPVVAASELFRGTIYENLARLLHQLTAPATFLWLSFGMLLLSSRWRHDPRMKKGSRPRIPTRLGSYLCFVVPSVSAGASQRILGEAGYHADPALARLGGASCAARRPKVLMAQAPENTRF